jgi:hypothetical protein
VPQVPDPEPTSVYRTGLPILFGMLGLVPVLILVIGLASGQWLVAAAAVPMAGFFGCAGRAGWVRAQSRAALVAGDRATRQRLATRAALWAVAGFACLMIAVLLLNRAD